MVQQVSYEEWLVENRDVLKPPEACEACGNTGWVPCDDCAGSGRCECEECGNDRECPTCKGDGDVPCDGCTPEGLERSARNLYDAVRRHEAERLREMAAAKEG